MKIFSIDILRSRFSDSFYDFSAQYDQLGGTTQVSDEGVAPVTSVIGSLDNQRGGVSVGGVGTAGAAVGTGSIGALTGTIPNKYLPAHLRT